MIKNHHKQNIVAFLVAATFFMENLDATVISPVLPQMAKSFNVNAVDLSSALSAYLVTLGIGIPVSGWLANNFGAKLIFSLAIFIFTFASALCGLVPTLEWFIFARVLQGVGGAMMVPVGRLVVLSETPKNKLIKTIAVLTWPALIAPVLGPPLGGFISEVSNWRWIFYLNIPIGLVAFILSLYLVPNKKSESKPPLDFFGFILIGSSFAILLWSLEQVGNTHISQIMLISSIILGLILFVLSLKWFKRKTDPLIDLSVMKEKTFSVVIYGGTLFRMGVSAIPFLLPIMLQSKFNYSPLKAGSMLMVVFAGNILMKPLTTFIMKTFGFKKTLIINGLFNSLSIAICALFTKESSLYFIQTILFLSGMTRSLQFTTYNTLAFSDIPKRLMNSANTLFSTIFQLSFGLGISLGAIGLRLGKSFGEALNIDEYSISFLLVSIFSFIGIIDSLKLTPDDGNILLNKGDLNEN